MTAPDAILLADPALPPRARLLQAARALFLRQGIHGVGVDAIATAAGSNKMTLYRHFASKDLLVAEYLRELAAEADQGWDQVAGAHAGDPGAQLEEWLRQVAAMAGDPALRGCPLANAAIELADPFHPGHAVIEAHKRDQRDKLARLCAEAGLADPEGLADEIVLLLEGGRVSLQSVGRDGPAARLTGMIRALIAAHAPRAA